MGTLDVARTLEVPGRLAFHSSSFTYTDAFPHGGTALGHCAGIKVAVRNTYYEVTGEEFGARVVEILQHGEDLRVTLKSLDADNDVLSQFMLNSSAGATSQHRVVEIGGGTNRDGYAYSGRAVPFLFSPLDPRSPMVVLYNAVPRASPDLEYALAFGQKYEGDFEIVALPDSSGRLGQIGRAVDLDT